MIILSLTASHSDRHSISSNSPSEATPSGPPIPPPVALSMVLCYVRTINSHNWEVDLITVKIYATLLSDRRFVNTVVFRLLRSLQKLRIGMSHGSIFLSGKGLYGTS